MSPRSEEQNQKIKDERHEKILKAALQVFADKGYATTKITDIATAAGMSHGLIYHYFTSKEAVYKAIVEDATRKAGDMSSRALALPGTPWERIEQMCEWTLAGIQANPEYYAIIIQALTSSDIPADVRAVLQETGQATYLNTLKLIIQGQEARQVIAGDPMELTSVYYALIQGIAIAHVAYRQQMGLSEQNAASPFVTTANTILRLLKA